MNLGLNYKDENRIENMSLIIDLIRTNSTMTRSLLAEMTQMTRMSITRIIARLIDQGVVIEEGDISSGRGRPAINLKLNTDALYFMSINIDVDNAEIAIINLENEIIARRTVFLEPGLGMEQYIDLVYSDFAVWAKNIPEIVKHISCIVLICPGVINSLRGEIILSAQMGWKNQDLLGYATSKFKLKIIVDNDVKTALIGELSSADIRDKSNLAYMSIGNGVGVGVWIDGKIMRGANNNAGEIGHISIDRQGNMCNCGRRGCIDTVLSIGSIVKKANNIDSSIDCIEDYWDKFKQGEDWAKHILDDVCNYFSIAINNIVCAYDPEVILVGGLIFDKIPEIRGFMLNSKYMEASAPFLDHTKITSARQGNKAGLIGGAIRGQGYLLEQLLLQKDSEGSLY